MGDVVMKKERYGSILSKLVASNLQCVGGIASNFNCLDVESLDEEQPLQLTTGVHAVLANLFTRILNNVDV